MDQTRILQGQITYGNKKVSQKKLHKNTGTFSKMNKLSTELIFQLTQ